MDLSVSTLQKEQEISLPVREEGIRTFRQGRRFCTRKRCQLLRKKVCSLMASRTVARGM